MRKVRGSRPARVKEKKPRKMLKGPGFIDEKKREEWN